MKKLSILIIIFISLFSCSGNQENAGDGNESGSDKHEWSILQGLEYDNREKADLKFQIFDNNGYSILQLPNESNVGAIYIILDPKAAPFYKQLPSKQFNLSKKEFDKIRKHPKTITTVEGALNSHVLE